MATTLKGFIERIKSAFVRSLVRSFYAPRHPRALHFHASFNEND